MSEEIFEYHRELQKMFKELMTGVIRYQDKNTGMWYQVMGFEGVITSYSIHYTKLYDYEDAFAFVILILILVLKPAGILGKNQKQKV